MPRRRLLHLILTGGLALGGQPDASGMETGQFEVLARMVAASPDDMLAGDRLRGTCRQQNVVARCVDFFERMAARHPEVDAIRFNAALAYVDHLPNHPLVLQATYSTHSIEHASAVLKREPDNWLALYIRGLNNLYWPLWFQRTDWAIADLTRCIEISRSLPPGRRQPYMALSFVALGDVYARLDKVPEAVATWRDGLSVVPSRQLQERLAIAPGLVHQAVEKIRNRDVPVDTGLEVFRASRHGNAS